MFHPRQLAIKSFCWGCMRCAELKTWGILVGQGVLRTCRLMKQSGIGAACVRSLSGEAFVSRPTFDEI
jgi:hypothetical protein